MAATNWFHVNDGLFFRRTDDGLVEVGEGPDFNSVAPLALIDASSWASVLAHVSARGEDATTQAEALAYHTTE